MILIVFVIIGSLVFGNTFTDEKIDTCPNVITSIPNSNHEYRSSSIQHLPSQRDAFLSNYKQRHQMKDVEVHIKNHLFTIIKYIATGSEGIAYLAQSSQDANQVVIKALIKEESTSASFKNEVYALDKLGRLIAYDEDMLIIVQTYIKGSSFSEVLREYSNDKAGTDEYPSHHEALHLKEKYFKILYKFRNATGMVHHDFRPYNIVGDEAIDFTRSEILSSDPVEREKEIKFDDKKAQDEWEWFYIDLDFAGIEENPFLPNSLEIAYTIWDKYLIRYSSYGEQTKKYRLAWMKVLHYIIMTNDTDSMQFPSESDFY